jgi:hypothetical protein
MIPSPCIAPLVTEPTLRPGEGGFGFTPMRETYFLAHQKYKNTKSKKFALEQ